MLDGGNHGTKEPPPPRLLTPDERGELALGVEPTCRAEQLDAQDVARLIEVDGGPVVIECLSASRRGVGKVEAADVDQDRTVREPFRFVRKRSGRKAKGRFRVEVDLEVVKRGTLGQSGSPLAMTVTTSTSPGSRAPPAVLLSIGHKVKITQSSIFGSGQHALWISPCSAAPATLEGLMLARSCSAPTFSWSRGDFVAPALAPGGPLHRRGLRARRSVRGWPDARAGR